MRIGETYRSEIVDILEVQDDGETEGGEVGHTCVVHQVLASEETGLASEDLKVVEPEDPPDDLSHVESVIVKSFERAVEVCLRLAVDLN